MSRSERDNTFSSSHMVGGIVLYKHISSFTNICSCFNPNP